MTAASTHRPNRRVRLVSLCLLLALAATACRAGDDVATELPADQSLAEAPAVTTDDEPSTAAEPSTPAPTAPAPGAPVSSLPRDLDVTAIECAIPAAGSTGSLTDQGREIYVEYLDGGAAVPTYELVVDINPQTGQVAGAMRAVLPAQDRTINLRVFAGMDAFDAGLTVDNVMVDGEVVDATLDRALLSLPAPLTNGTTNTVELSFGFTIDQMAANDDIFGALTGEALQPDQVGLLGRTDTGMQLGHWFPVWLPDGIRTDPDPSGFGDIGAFPAADICATISVPSDYEVVTSGSRVETTETSMVEAGAGLRDFSILISNDLVLATRIVQGVEIRVWGPAADPAALGTVLTYAEDSLIVLTQAFGPYPWKEIDIISAPLGAGVGGMEWPGAVWIEESMFAGGIAGLGDLGDIFGDDELGALLESVGGDALTTTLEWTIAHELGHEWWHATVGNDSIESPAVDEPLAQFSACLVMARIHPDNWRDICNAQTVEQYAQARALGVNDTAAEQASDEFESSLQYGAVVYGKAPGFYFAAGEVLGWDNLVAALRSFVDDNAFALVSTNDLRSHLVQAAGADGPEIGYLWDRWFREARGDEDIEASEQLSGLGGLADLDLESLDLESLDLDELFGEDVNIEDLLQDFIDATEGD